MPCYLFDWRNAEVEEWKARSAPSRGGSAGASAVAVARRPQRPIWKAGFTSSDQRLLVASARFAARRLGIRLHGVAADAGGVRLVVSWREGESLPRIRRELRGELARGLSRRLDARRLEPGGRRRRIVDGAAFEAWLHEELPRCRGWKWREGRGLYR